ncbi:MAG: hypothetical protein PVSMB1_17560 [Gemmatimonadaceae bacterium]
MFERAGDHLLASDRLLDLVGASEQERELWAIDPGYPGYTLTSRLDSFMVSDSVRFVEYNAESPAGIGFEDVLSEVFAGLPAMRAWHRDAASPYTSRGRSHLLDTLLWTYRAHGGSGTPTIAIIDWDDVITRRDFEICADYFRSHGVPTVIADPRRLTYEHGEVQLGDVCIDLVYRRVLLHELLAKSAEIQPLLDAYRDGAICMVNSPRSKLLHKKSVFALLSDQGLGLDVSPHERDVIERTITWTRYVFRGTTEFHGRKVDLPNLLLSEQERFAVKPVDDYGGRGVALGWDLPRDAWEQALERALNGGYIVQERVPVPEAEFPVWRDNQVEEVSLLLDTNPLMFRGELGSILTRLSGQALLNVSAGAGSVAPTYVLPEEWG